MVAIGTLSFTCYKIAPRLPLDRIASFFKMQRELIWKDYIVIQDEHIDMILQYEAAGRYVYVFRFGCISFVNFTDYEIRVFLKHIESIIGEINYNLFSSFYETHVIQLDEKGCGPLFRDERGSPVYCGLDIHKKEIIHIVALILAKSTELHKIEADISNLLDEAEKLILFLHKGKLGGKIREIGSTVGRILRFEYDSIWDIRIFDRQSHGEHSEHLRRIYDAMEKYYELHDRFDIIESKAADLRNITRNYYMLSFRQNESRLYWFEIFLLALFPAAHAVRYILGRTDIIGMMRAFFK